MFSLLLVVWSERGCLCLWCDLDLRDAKLFRKYPGKIKTAIIFSFFRLCGSLWLIKYHIFHHIHCLALAQEVASRIPWAGWTAGTSQVSKRCVGRHSGRSAEDSWGSVARPDAWDGAYVYLHKNIYMNCHHFHSYYKSNLFLLLNVF